MCSIRLLSNKNCYFRAVFFELTTSSVSWPADKYKVQLYFLGQSFSCPWFRFRDSVYIYLISFQDYLLDNLGATDQGAKNLIDKGLDEENFLQLQVYYEELNFEKVKESEAYTVLIFLPVIFSSINRQTKKTNVDIVACIHFRLPSSCQTWAERWVCA